MSDVFRVPESEADKPENRYTFAVGEQEFSLPKLAFIDGDAVAILAARITNTIERDEAHYRFFESQGIGPIRSLEIRQLDALVEDYQKASGITPGESETSSSS